MKSQQEIQERIQILVSEATLGQVTESKPEARLIEDLGLDSLDYAGVMLGLEDWVGVKIDEGKVQWSEVRTVAQLAALFVRTQLCK